MIFTSAMQSKNKLIAIHHISLRKSEYVSSLRINKAKPTEGKLLLHMHGKVPTPDGHARSLMHEVFFSCLNSFIGMENTQRFFFVHVCGADTVRNKNLSEEFKGARKNK
jgi:hypothetical protein